MRWIDPPVRRDVGSGKPGTDGNGPSGGPSLSADGRLLAFVSSADNLVAGDTDGSVDGVALSGNGRYLAFSATGTGDGLSHIWVEDLRTGAVQRVKDTVDTGYDTVRQPATSADGRHLAFVSADPGDTNRTTGPTYATCAPGAPSWPARTPRAGRTTRACPPR
ncbi:TolB family protein [Streptomyces iakyrus]|uniref:TolB family protein n=1 Tax=Streptomyces iakyrus TaxID=68219 RepID=UPI0036D03CA5